MDKKIRVFCVDDDSPTLLLYKVTLDFEPDMELVGTRQSTDNLSRAVEESAPTVLLLDLLIPDCEPLKALTELRAKFPDLAILVVSGLDDPGAVSESFRCGASGFFLKTMDLSDLTSIIRRAANGERIAPVPKHQSEDSK